MIRVLDFETTGIEPPAEVIEMGWCDVSKVEGGVSVGGPSEDLKWNAQRELDRRAGV